MDKTADGKEEVKEDTTDTTHLLQMPFDPKKLTDLNDILQTIDEYQKKALAAIDKELNTRLLMRNQNPLRLLRYIADITHEMARWTVHSTYAIDCITIRVTALEKIVDEITQTLKMDLPNVKAELENLKTMMNAPAVNIGKALAKLDKGRQEILRDSVV